MSRNGVSVHSVEAGPRTGSDHLPVIATFSIP
jgi:endonuclease/exonuclease/phosphatase (EEP) superfamily protein YafD